jgi:hypothetical protein
MTDQSITIAEAERVLNLAAPDIDVHVDEAASLLIPIRAMATTTSMGLVNRVGEALLSHEITCLTWVPIHGVLVIRALINCGATSPLVLSIGLDYLSMYFQELDDEIANVRRSIQTGRPKIELEVVLVGLIESLEGVE